jgi:hypothetical protein
MGAISGTEAANSKDIFGKLASIATKYILTQEYTYLDFLHFLQTS